MNGNTVSTSENLFPVLIDLSKKHVTVLSDPESGEDTLTIIKKLIPCTDRLTVLSSSFDGRLEQLSGEYPFVLKIKKYEREDLYDADVVICALVSREIKDDVHAACRTLGIRLSILSEPWRSDFIPDISAAEKTAISKGSTFRTNDRAYPAMSRPEEQKEESPSLNQVIIYTDGAARGNPDGPGGYGAVIEFTDSSGKLHIKELSQGYVKTTNNRMELMAAIAALEALTKPCRIELWSDSKYLVSAFNEHWIDSWIRRDWMRTKSEPVKNVDLWKRLLDAARPHCISWNWVKGHDGHPQNERCDKLATSAADSLNLIPDPGIEPAG